MDQTILYKYVLNESTGQVSVQEISDYEKGKWADREPYFRIQTGRYNYCYCYQKDLDRYRDGHVYSFDNDVAKAIRIIKEAVELRRDKYKKEYDRWEDVLKKLENANDSN